MIALTFDDGPNQPFTGQILDVLRDFGVKATFFALGKWVPKAPEIVKRAASEGHEIGNHSYFHPTFNSLSESEGISEITACYQALKDAEIASPTLFRAPFGNIPQWMSPKSSVSWDIHGNDWVTQEPDAIVKPIFDYLDAHEHGIVLLHDGYYREFGFDRSGTAEAARRILERYPRERFCTVSQLLAA